MHSSSVHDCVVTHLPATVTVAADYRAPQGAQPLYWGATEEGQLLLGSHLDELEGCSPTATMFPPGGCAALCKVCCSLDGHPFLQVCCSVDVRP
jgi:hypothetical protein